MTLPQGLSFAVIGGMLVLFVWDRWRYDVVALVALLAAVACGIVPTSKAFSGFSNPLLPLIASALVVSTAVGKSGLIERLLHLISPLMRSDDLMTFILVTAVTFLSALMKNVGALAIFLPVAIQAAERNGRSPSQLLMPLAFGSLVGGMMTLIGTSPNIIISSERVELLGKPYEMFDFLPVGLGIVVVGIVFLTFGWRLIPRGRKAQTPPEAAFRIEDYVAEAHIPADSPFVGRTVAELEELGEGDLTVAAIIRENYRRYVPSGHWTLFADDVLVLECDPHVLESVVADARLELVGSKGVDEEALRSAEVATVEAVVTAGSPLIGSSLAEQRLRGRYGINVLAVSRRGRRMTVRLRRAKFQVGDVIVVQGSAAALPDTLASLRCLPLAERRLSLGRPRKVALPVIALAAAVTLAATELVPVALAFTGAAVALALLRVITLREIYDSIEWPILILLGALIPVGQAVHETGATELIAQWLSHVAAMMPAFGVVATVMIITMLVTPLLHHAAAVIVMGPIAASLAVKLGLNVDPFLMAVACGASCDFLSPIGHQCNTLVMGPGGYRFTDYWHLGLPLSILVVLTGTPLITLVWPLH
ncbi:MAG TPA: SLC13 family permease [Stellaceae bacterium]|nr:SLC13 family permease [Stellaceae bacterium]